ncbi:LPXTG cell wall anchor domain-containing protein [Limosilactobacillus sp.]|uniref:LPXTG cell wall anchor domain-containing protein n=1 Tax=Limosilactobacillus sp. TaxID=2773925 RepID=UPI003EFDFBA0
MRPAMLHQPTQPSAQLTTQSIEQSTQAGTKSSELSEQAVEHLTSAQTVSSRGQVALTNTGSQATKVITGRQNSTDQVAKQLPQTGNNNNQAISLIGVAFTAALSLLGIKKRRN